MCSRKRTDGRSAHPISNRNECKAFDQGLLTVSGHSVQLTDASEFATCVHVSGPRDDLKAFDQGLLTVSGHLVQLTDASEFATCVHASGPRDDLLIQSQ
jgi:hypothetical protein